jgi:hypothetical protein
MNNNIDATPVPTTPSRASRQKAFRPHFKRGPKKQWDPSRVGVVPGYPKTAEGYERRRQGASERAFRLNAEGRMTRRGVPDGWAGRKAEIAAARDQATQEARQMVATLRGANVLDLDDARAEIAMEYVLSVVRDVTETAATRTTAARITLSFLKARPGARVDLALSAAEEVLAALNRAAA